MVNQAVLNQTDLDVRALSEPDWVRTFLSIPNEEEQVVRFVYDPLQVRMTQEQTTRDVWVKPRQVRCSSRILARNLRRVTTSFGTHCLTIAKDDDMVQKFRQRILLHCEDLDRHGQLPRVTKDDKNELIFGDMAGSRFIWASSEESKPGRSFTAHVLHASEVAHWGSRAGDILGGIIPAIPDPPFGQVDLESTPNGAVGVFYDFAMAAKWQGTNLEDDYTLHFYEWWQEHKYTRQPTDEQEQSFQPTDDERKLMTAHDLTIGQILWRRRAMRDMAKTQTPFEQEYPEDLLGCFLLGGNSYFEVDALKWHLDMSARPILVLNQLEQGQSGVKFEGWGEARPGRPILWATNQLLVYETPQEGQEYVAFVDPSEGHKNSDNGSITVMHARSRRVVAVVAIKVIPNRLAEMACAIGSWYNNAYLAIERNRISACILRALDLGYPNLYYDIDEEDPTQQKRKAGWYSNRDKRTRILSRLKDDIESYMTIIRDHATVREMYTFTWEHVRRTGELQWKAQAQQGAMDDRILSLAGANFLCDDIIASPVKRERGQTTRRTIGWL